jgi:hypothetical protein
MASSASCFFGFPALGQKEDARIASGTEKTKSALLTEYRFLQRAGLRV